MSNPHIDRESRRGRSAQRRTIRLVIVPVVTLGLAACSSSGSASETSSTSPTTTVATALATTPTTTPETTTPETTPPETVPATSPPTTTEPLPPALPRFGALTAGTTYRIARATLGRQRAVHQLRRRYARTFGQWRVRADG